MIAVKIPATGGNPEAMEIPRQRGNAIRNTRKPEVRSAFQFLGSPAKPDCGTSILFSFIF
jgi:hypothetical protein